jgi:diamine N-acetyltransferase
MEGEQEKIEKDIIITSVNPEDVRGMQEVFYRTWLDTYPNEEAGITVDDIEDRYKDHFTEEALAKRTEGVINPPEGHTLFVAKEGDKVIGVCRVVNHSDKNQLQAIYVLPEYQGRGVGYKLWEEAQKHFDKDKDTIVQVATYNTKAIEFYKKLGFADNGRRFSDERFKMKSGAIIPEMEMVIKVK